MCKEFLDLIIEKQATSIKFKSLQIKNIQGDDKEDDDE